MRVPHLVLPLLLAGSAVARAQRLPPIVPSAATTVRLALRTVHGESPGAEYALCSVQPLGIAVGGLAGAFAGWLSYEVSFGVWGPARDPVSRHLKHGLVYGGFALGAIYEAIKLHRDCSRRFEGTGSSNGDRATRLPSSQAVLVPL